MTVCVVLMSMAFLCPIAGAQSEKQGNTSAQDLLLRSEVETAVSMLRAISAKHERGEMTLKKAKELGADLLRELSTEPTGTSGPIQLKASMWFFTAEKTWRDGIGLKTRTKRARST